MKKLGAYIGDSYSNLEKNTFVWYEVFRCVDDMYGNYGNDVYDMSFWSIKGGYPDGRKPDAMCSTTTPQSIEKLVIPMKELANRYCIVWDNCNWQIKDCTVRYNYLYNYEYISTLKVDQFGPNNYTHWEWGEGRAMSVLKDAKVNRIDKLEEPHTVNDLVMPVAIKEELKKSMEKAVMNDALIMSSAKYDLNSIYGIGGFTTNPDPFKVVKIAEKETKTMEKKTMTETDTFLKHINGITITSKYSKLDFGTFGDPYYIYYPEMEITESIADTLLTVLLMAKREYIHKIVFNPEKGTTTIYCNWGSATVRCKDCEFDYILGYEMARLKVYYGKDDYNWFNKIKNHRKTHIEYATPERPKRGGKKS